MRKLISLVLVFLAASTIQVYALSISTVPQGGTGWGNIQSSNILVGNGTTRLATSSDLVFSTSLRRFTATYASSTAFTSTTICLTGDTCRTTWPSASISGGTAGMLTAWTDATTLTATGTPTAASYFATSTTATSTFNGALRINNATSFPVMSTGTSTNGCPIYGCIIGDVFAGEWDFNGIASIEVVNGNSGSCAGSGLWADGNIPTLNNNFAFFGFANVGWDRSGTCGAGTGAEFPLDAFIHNPTRNIDIELSSTTPTAFKVFGINNLLVMSATSSGIVGIPNASSTNLSAASLWDTGLTANRPVMSDSNKLLTSYATSTEFGTGTGGQFLVWANGVPAWTASTTYQHPLTFATSTGQVQCPTCSTATGANPTGVVGSVAAVNGSATTYMRSDGAPGCTAATALVPGCLSALNWTQFNGKVGTSTPDVATQIVSWATTNATPPNLTSFAGYTSTAALFTLTNASTTNLSAATALFVPQASTMLSTDANKLVQSTTLSAAFSFSSPTLSNKVEHSVTRISTTSAWGFGTSTTGLEETILAKTVVNARCRTTGGVLDVDFYQGSTHLAYIQASTTNGLITFTANNTLAAGNSLKVDIGSSTSNATAITCTTVSTI